MQKDKGEKKQIYVYSPSSFRVLVEDINILLPVKLRWIQFSCFRWEIENVSANNNMPGR